MGKMGLTFLVIEDEESVARVHARYLESFGCVEVAPSAEIASKMLAIPNRWSGIVLDPELPGAEGLDLLQRLRTHDQSVPVLVVTGVASTEHVNRVQALGGYYAKKPISLANYSRFIADAQAFEAARCSIADKLGSDWCLSARQLQVLRLILSGCSRTEVSDRMALSEDTVRKHIRAILSKSGLQDTREVLARALERAVRDR